MRVVSVIAQIDEGWIDSTRLARILLRDLSFDKLNVNVLYYIYTYTYVSAIYRTNDSSPEDC